MTVINVPLLPPTRETKVSVDIDPEFRNECIVISQPCAYGSEIQYIHIPIEFFDLFVAGLKDALVSYTEGA